MSIKKSIMMLSAMAAMASMNPGYTPSFPDKPRYRTLKANQKKCKSCANFSYSSCPWRNWVKPLDAACREHYEKRKK